MGAQCAFIQIRKGWNGYEQRAGSQCTSTKSAEIEVLSCVCGYHVYKNRWAAAVGELLTCSRGPTNGSNRYAFAMIKEGTTIGHLPQKISKVCSIYLRSGGENKTGSRCFLDDLPQGDWRYHAYICMCSCFNIRIILSIQKNLHTGKYSTNKFSDECCPKIVPRQEKVITVT